MRSFVHFAGLLSLNQAARLSEQSLLSTEDAADESWSRPNISFNKPNIWRMIGRDWCAKGIKNGDICCGGDCGRCGGRSCADAPGGPEECCVGNIESTNRPCINSRDTGCVVPEGKPPPDNGLTDWCESGLLNGEVCCLKACGQCGGTSCGAQPGGAEGCCIGAIVRSGRTCNTTSDAGCLVPPEPTRPADCAANERCAGKPGLCCPADDGSYDPCCGSWTPTTTTTTTTTQAASKQWCRRGFREEALCCAAECGACGGAGCSKRNGGAAKCCASSVRSNGYCKSEDDTVCLIPWN